MELKKLASIANKLDSLGLTKEADIIDNFIIKVAVRQNANVTPLDIKAAENPNIVYFVDKATGGWYEYRGYGNSLRGRGYANILLVEGEFPTSFEMKTFLDGNPQGRVLEFVRAVSQAAPLRLGEDGKIQRNKDGSPLLDAAAFGGNVYSVRLKDQSSAPKKPSSGAGATSGGAKGSGKGASGGGTGSGGAGGVDSWARYIATAKDPKTGKVDTELNTRVKQMWQSTRPADKEFSGFTSWYRQTKDNMSAYGMTPKDFSQEQAIALVQITGGSAKGWQQSDKAMRSVYENIAGQDPASFNPSSVGLSRSGVGYAADIKNYNPTDGRTSAPAQALLRSQMAIPAEEEYAGRAETFRDDSEFEFAPGVEKEMAARRQRSQQAMSGPTYQQGTSDELKYKTKNLLSR